MLTLRSPPLLEICVLHSIVVLFFWLNKTFCSSLNIRHAYLQVHLPSAKANNDNNADLFTSLILDIKSNSGNDPLLPWPRYASLSLSLWVALLMVLKSKIFWHFVYTEGLERWRIRCLRKFWTRSCHGFCRSAHRPLIPIVVTKTTYGTSAFGYSWYFTNPSLFSFSFFRFLLDDFDSGSLGFLEVVWFLWKWRGKMWKSNLDALEIFLVI